MNDWEHYQEALDRAEAEMVEGYLDGFDLGAPNPSGNRSRCYKHGFKNGRADKSGKICWHSVDEARYMAAVAIALDAQTACPVVAALNP